MLKNWRLKENAEQLERANIFGCRLTICLFNARIHRFVRHKMRTPLLTSVDELVDAERPAAFNLFICPNLKRF